MSNCEHIADAVKLKIVALLNECCLYFWRDSAPHPNRTALQHNPHRPHLLLESSNRTSLFNLYLALCCLIVSDVHQTFGIQYQPFHHGSYCLVVAENLRSNAKGSAELDGFEGGMML